MPKASPLQDSFNSGEFSPLVQGKITADRYKTGLDTCLNWLPLAQGPVTRRPGTYFSAAVKDSIAKTRLQAFVFSETQAYILEFGNDYIRFYRNGAQILILGVPVEVVTTYTTAEVFQLKFAQSADTLYIVHPNHFPASLTRTSDTVWTYTTLTFNDGPYVDQNRTTTTMNGSAATGAIIVNASSVVGINNGQGFLASDVGRLIRVFNGGAVSIAIITARNTSVQVAATVTFGNFVAGTGVTTWRLSLFGTTNGYPGCVVFHEDRLFFSGVNLFPDKVVGSNSSDYLNFSPTLTDGSVTANLSIDFTLNSSEINKVLWMASDEKGLNLGTIGSEWNIRPSSLGEALSPTNVNAKKTTRYGSANIQPIQIGKATMFVQRGLKKLREMVFFYDVEGFRANDLTLNSEHITGPGIVQMALSIVPQQIVWAVRSDGILAAMNYEREVDVLKVGWSRHSIGQGSNENSFPGYSAAIPAFVESVAVIPDSTGTWDQVWVTVRRVINGNEKRYVEYLTKIFENTDDQNHAFFVDAGLTYDVPLTPTAVSFAAPPVVGIAAHGLVTGQSVRFLGMSGLIVAATGLSAVNNKDFVITVVDANNISLDGQDFSAGVSGYINVIPGIVRKLVSTLSGLTHLANQDVGVLVDGAVQSTGRVSNAGVLTLASPGTVINVGLKYNSDLRFLRPDVGAADGTAHGKIRRVHRFGMDYYRTLGLMLGPDFNSLDRIEMRERSDVPGRAPSLKSEIKVETIAMNYDFDNKVCLRVSDPLPATILAVMPRLHEEDA